MRCFVSFCAIPPVPIARQQLNRVDGDHDRLSAFLSDDFDAVRRAIFSPHIHHEALPDSSPTRFLSAPFHSAAGVRQLFSIEETTAGTNNAVGKMAAGTLKQVSSGQRMNRSLSVIDLSPRKSSGPGWIWKVHSAS